MDRCTVVRNDRAAKCESRFGLFALTCVAFLFVGFAEVWAEAPGTVGKPEKAGTKANAPRIVSLAPSNTELIYSLDAGEQLIGVSDVCDYPPEAKKKEKVGSFNSIKLEKLSKLHPDKIVLIGGQEALANTLKKHGMQISLLDNSSIERIPENLEILGVITGKELRAKVLKDSFSKSLSDLKAIISKSKSRPRVLICVWPQPLMTAGRGSFMDQCITICGGVNCTGDLAQPYPRINPERLLLAKADMIIVPNEVRNEKFWLKAPWKYMKAVKENKLYVLPQHETDCLYRPTLRIKDALYWLASTLHPECKVEIEKWYGKSK